MPTITYPNITSRNVRDFIVAPRKRFCSPRLTQMAGLGFAHLDEQGTMEPAPEILKNQLGSISRRGGRVSVGGAEISGRARRLDYPIEINPPHLRRAGRKPWSDRRRLKETRNKKSAPK
jgi:hypothetical protein